MRYGGLFGIGPKDSLPMDAKRYRAFVAEDVLRPRFHFLIGHDQWLPRPLFYL